MKRTEVITVQWKTVPYIYNTTCKETNQLRRTSTNVNTWNRESFQK